MDGTVVFACRGEVMAEDGGHLRQAVGGARLEVPGGSGMELAPSGAQQAAIGRVTDQCVPETVEGLRLASELGQNTGRDELGEGAVELRA